MGSVSEGITGTVGGGKQIIKSLWGERARLQVGLAVGQGW